MKDYIAPIIVLVYNRVKHFENCINSLLKNDLAKKSPIFIVSDAPSQEKDKESIKEIRDFSKSIKGFGELNLLFWDRNIGGHESLKKAINIVFEKYESFIFLEDDIIVSTNFLQYMNDGLNYYKDDPRIMAICGFKAMFDIPNNYNNDVYFYPCNSPWGFGIWKNRWEQIDYSSFDRYSELKKDPKKYKEFTSIGFYIKGILQADSRKEIVAGDLRVYYHMFQNHMCSVFPVVSKTQNWGFDGTGEHCDNKKAWWAKPPLDTRNASTRFIPFIEYNNELLKNHRRFQDKINGGILAKYLKYTWIHRLWKKLKKHL